MDKARTLSILRSAETVWERVVEGPAACEHPHVNPGTFTRSEVLRKTGAQEAEPRGVFGTLGP